MRRSYVSAWTLLTGRSRWSVLNGVGIRATRWRTLAEQHGKVCLVFSDLRQDEENLNASTKIRPSSPLLPSLQTPLQPVFASFGCSLPSPPMFERLSDWKTSAGWRWRLFGKRSAPPRRRCRSRNRHHPRKRSLKPSEPSSEPARQSSKRCVSPPRFTRGSWRPFGNRRRKRALYARRRRRRWDKRRGDRGV